MIDMYKCGICAFRNNVTTLSTNKQTKETFITNIACRMIASHIYRGPRDPSKRGNHTLFTCLSLPKFSSINKTKATNLCLIP